jgi:hypothetical protein
MYMRITPYLVGILSLAGVFAMAGCAADPNKSTEDPEVKTLPAAVDEVVPAYGINFARFPTSAPPASECTTLIDNHVPYARVNFGFDQSKSIEDLLAPIDLGMNDAAANGVHILPIIYPVSPLPKDGNAASAYLASLEVFTERLARTYGPHGTFMTAHPTAQPIRAWEIANEPNLKPFSVGNANAYRRILRAARRGLRTGDPRARIIFCGLRSVTNTCDIEATADKFLSEVITPADRCLIDAVAYHPYAHTSDMAHDNAEALATVMRSQLHLMGGSSSKDDVQLWLTEIGWGIIAGGSSGPAVADEDSQAQEIRRFAFLSNQERNRWNLGPTMWYVYTDEIAASNTGWAALAGVYKSAAQSPHVRPAWGVIGNFANQQPWTQLPAVHLCPTDGDPSASNQADGESTPLSTQTELTLNATQDGTPGTASVSGCTTAVGTMNVNFEKFMDSKWTLASTAHPTPDSNRYAVLNWAVGVGQWRVRAVSPKDGEHLSSESDYKEFVIKSGPTETRPLPTDTFLTMDGFQNGAPGSASVSGNVFRSGGNTPVIGTVNVNFQRLVGVNWMLESTAQRTLVNGHYEVRNWGVGVGQWRVRAVFPAQGDYDGSESNYHEFSIQPVATNAFITVNQVLPGQPGHVSVSGHVLRTNGNPVSGTVNVNFDKIEGGAWTYKSTAQPQLVNGGYEVRNWGVGVGQWRVRAVFPAQGDYASSESEYHEFVVNAR